MLLTVAKVPYTALSRIYICIADMFQTTTLGSLSVAIDNQT